MMRLMRSLVSTQALPVVEFELSTLGLLFTSQPLSVYISKFTQKERRFISKSFGKQ